MRSVVRRTNRSVGCQSDIVVITVFRADRTLRRGYFHSESDERKIAEDGFFIGTRAGITFGLQKKRCGFLFLVVSWVVFGRFEVGGWYHTRGGSVTATGV